METVTEHIRRHLTSGIYLDTENGWRAKRAEQRVAELFDGLFDFAVREMKQRIRMGTFRYETKDVAPWSELVRAGLVPSYLDKLRDKLDLYKDTRNQEFLVDAQNYINLELHDPCLEGTFYKSTERHE